MSIKVSGKIAAAAVLAVLAYNLWTSWALYAGVPLSDPVAYPDLARASHFFYDSGLREPVPVFLTKLMLAAGLSDGTAPRAVTVVVFAVSVLLLLFVAGKVRGPAAGLAAAALLAANPYAGYYCVQGVSNLTSGLLLMVFWFGLSGKEMSRKKAVLLGAAGGLCMLTRLENILVVLLIILIYALSERSKRRAVFGAFVLAVSLVLTAPYLAHQYRKFGNPVYSNATAARFWLNTEKNGPRSGDRFTGGPMGLGEFILRDGPSAAAVNLVKAYGTGFFHYLPRLLHYKITLLAALAGIFFLLKKREYPDLLLLPVLLLPVSFIANIDQVAAGSGVELRFYLNSLWLLCVYCGIGISGAAALLWKAAEPALQKLRAEKRI